MPEENFIISVFCCVADLLKRSPDLQKIRQRGFAPQLCDSEVITRGITIIK